MYVKTDGMIVGEKYVSKALCGTVEVDSDGKIWWTANTGKPTREIFPASNAIWKQLEVEDG